MQSLGYFSYDLSLEVVEFVYVYCILYMYICIFEYIIVQHLIIQHSQNAEDALLYAFSLTMHGTNQTAIASPSVTQESPN